MNDPKPDTVRPSDSESEDEHFGIQDVPKERVPYIVFSAFCMGTADVVPGVSGGTMAVALGIYQQLLAGITSVNVHALKALARLDFKRLLSVLHWKFLASLGSGVALAVVIMVKIVKLPTLVTTQPKLVYAVFLGLVLASALVLAKRIPAWNGARAGALVVGAVVGFAVVNLVPVATPENAGFVFFCGVVAISAMLLPGISGSFILLVLGKYAYVLDSVSNLLHGELGALSVVVPFALGCLVGLLAFSRFLGWLLYKWNDTVMAVLTGLLIGSLWRIWPYQTLGIEVIREKPRVVSAEPFLPDSIEIPVVALFLVGLLAVLVIEALAARREPAS